MDLKMSPEEDNVNNINSQTAFETQVQNTDSSIESTHYKCNGFESSQELNGVNSSQSDEIISEDNGVIIQELHIVNDSVVLNISSNHSLNCPQPPAILMDQDTSSEVQLQDNSRCEPEPHDTPLFETPVVGKDSQETTAVDDSICNIDFDSVMLQHNSAEETETYSVCYLPPTEIHADKNDIGTAEYNLVENSSIDNDAHINSQWIDAATILCSLGAEGNNSGTEIEEPEENLTTEVAEPNSFAEFSQIHNTSDKICADNSPALEEYDSDSTIPMCPYKTENMMQSKQVTISDVAKSSNSSKPKCFSPLPSTSSDYVTFDINDMRLNEAEGNQNYSDIAKDAKCESPFIIVDGDTASSEIFQDPKNDVIQVSSVETNSLDNDVSILVCENDNEPVTVDLVNDTPKQIDPNEVIDLLGDDSDCEIIDVDKVANEPFHFLEGPIDLSTSCEVSIVNNVSSEVVSSTIRENLNPIPLQTHPSIPIDLDVPISPFSVRDQTDSQLSRNDGNMNIYLERLLEVIDPISNAHDRSKHSQRDMMMVKMKRTCSKRESTSGKRRRNNSIIDLSETGVSNMPTVPKDSPLSSGPAAMTHMSMGSVSIRYPVYTSQRLNMIPPPMMIPMPTYPPNNTNISNPPQETPAKSCLGECPVCYETLSISATASTFCGHIFCLECIKKVMKTSKKCPKCRKALTGRGFHQIFL